MGGWGGAKSGSEKGKRHVFASCATIFSPICERRGGGWAGPGVASEGGDEEGVRA